MQKNHPLKKILHKKIHGKKCAQKRKKNPKKIREKKSAQKIR